MLVKKNQAWTKVIKMKVNFRTYSELLEFDSFKDRLLYLELRDNKVGESTFGHARYLNQKFYKSAEWIRVRREVLIRDLGCDLGVPGYEIPDLPLIHHMNPMSPDDIIHGNDWILDPEFLITVSHDTHNAIHYGAIDMGIPTGPRSPGDTTLW